MAAKPLHRNFFQRILGICATPPPQDHECWTHRNGTVVIDLERATELSSPDSAVRLEGKDLSKRLLVLHGGDGAFHAYCNKCGHGGRRLDPVPDGDSVQCCSVGKTTYDYSGNVISGPAKKALVSFPVKQEGTKLVISLP